MDFRQNLQILLICAAVSLVLGQNADYWNSQARASLQQTIRIQAQNTNTAKNIIMFLGDGMGVETMTATRILKGQAAGGSGEDAKLAQEDFPYFGLAKTYSTNKQVPDSAATATAYLCGVKTKTGVLGVDDRVTRSNCQSSLGGEVQSILEMAQAAGKSVGLITTATITHASPAALYAKVPDREWQSDADIPFAQRNRGCIDIAQQFVNNNNIQVAMGGGRAKFTALTAKDPEYPQLPGSRIDGRDLTQEWVDNKPDPARAQYVWNEADFNQVDPATTDYLLGVFEYGHMKFEDLRVNDTAGEPSIAEMTDKAIRILNKNPNGFFLFVEGGRIDHAHHLGVASIALGETLAMDNAIDAALGLVDTTETLVIVTADHTHTFKMAGYAPKGSPILGMAQERGKDFGSYTTLGYMNGPGGMIANLAYQKIGHRPRVNDDKIGKGIYFQQAIVPIVGETHGGDDVGISAIGPMAHLVHGVHEQNYVAHVMQRAFCLGSYCQAQGQDSVDDDAFETFSGAAPVLRTHVALFLLTLVALFITL